MSLAAALFLLIPLLAANPAATRKLKQFDVFLGYDGITPPWAWSPIIVEILNDGPTIKGRLEIEASAIMSDAVRIIPIELPTGTRKRLCVPVYHSGFGMTAWNVRLRDASGEVRDEVVNLTSRQNMLVGSLLLGTLPRGVAGSPLFAEVARNFHQYQPLVARFTPELFPDHPLALEGLSALYLNAEKAGELKENQVRALMAWLHQGGHLLIGLHTPSDVNTSPWLRNILPLVPENLETLPCGRDLHQWVSQAHQRLRVNASNPEREQRGFGPLLKDSTSFLQSFCPVVTGRIRDGRVLLAHQTRPLILSAERGRGMITLLTFAPELEPFRSWSERRYFWTKLAEAPFQLYEPLIASAKKPSEPHFSYPQWNQDAAFGVLVDSRQIHKLPLGWLFVMLLGYLAAIGPLDYWLLKKLKRPMLTWITFPCYVAAFSLLIYFVGYKIRAGDLEWNEFHVVDVHPRDQGRAMLRGWAFNGIYSEKNASYAVASSAPWSGYRQEGNAVYHRAFLGNPPLKLEQRGESFSGEVFVPVWTTRVFVEEYWQPVLQIPFSASVARSNHALVLTLRNHLKTPLSAVAVITPNMDRLSLSADPDAARVMGAGDYEKYTVFSAIGPLGSTNLTLTSSKPLRQFVSENRNRLLTAVQSRYSTFETERINFNSPDDYLHWAMAASFWHMTGNQDETRSMRNDLHFDLTECVQRGHIVVMALVEGQLPKAPLHAADLNLKRQQRRTLYRLTLPLPQELSSNRQPPSRPVIPELQ